MGRVMARSMDKVKGKNDYLCLQELVTDHDVYFVEVIALGITSITQ